MMARPDPACAVKLPLDPACEPGGTARRSENRHRGRSARLTDPPTHALAGGSAPRVAKSCVHERRRLPARHSRPSSAGGDDGEAVTPLATGQRRRRAGATAGRLPIDGLATPPLRDILRHAVVGHIRSEPPARQPDRDGVTHWCCFVVYSTWVFQPRFDLEQRLFPGWFVRLEGLGIRRPVGRGDWVSSDWMARPMRLTDRSR
jgi:hypothetical protein